MANDMIRPAVNAELPSGSFDGTNSTAAMLHIVAFAATPFIRSTTSQYNTPPSGNKIQQA
ncbi:hypothetical protein [Mesorhizobium sp. L2C066B000]|uniref:hypothetical protein n=1 Tax=Mesorhizobium sp. L2C066B000 TaxID=1287105 RepID=UPI0018CBA50F|nr:hypothetical protein [Mesorhizobium sp. L2C066B000]